MFIDNVIGDGGSKTYQKWENGKVVLLTAQTGKGKTYFILNTLLQYVIENNSFIFYFVNRKLLKKQIENDIRDREIQLSQNNIYVLNDYIKVYTYQSIENSNKHIEIKNKIKDLQNKYNFDDSDKPCHNIFFIYDECHYFYCDSNFNTKTEVSYYHLRNIIQNQYKQKYNIENNDRYYSPNENDDKILKWNYIEIFMSATMEQMKSKIYEDNNKDSIFYFQRHDNSIVSYDFALDYSYVNINILNSKQRIPDLIINSNEKWLIFVDNKNYGKELMDILKNNKIDIAYIDTDYENDDDSKQTVNNITENSLSQKRVIISTSVLDNGVSIKDEALRNLIILVDNKETFLQMLGRIRINDNNDKVNLYICNKTKQDFEKRIKSLYRLNKFYQKYEKSMFADPKIHPLKINNEHSDYSKKLRIRQSKLLDDIFSNPVTIHYARKLCYSVYGLLASSSFSVQRCNQLIAFYQDIIKKFNSKGENAFIYTVCEWLGKTDFEIEKLIIKEQNKNTSMYKGSINKVLSEKLSKKNNILLSKDENENIKEKLLKEFIFFLNIEKARQLMPDKEINNIIKDIKKKGRTIPSNKFNIIMEIANLPYKLTTKRNAGYLLEKV